MKPETFFDNFEVLAEAPNCVQELRELILKLAFHGKLSSHNEMDEPASVLLERIKAGKKQLIKEKLVKIEKPLLPIANEEIPHKIPNLWFWVRLGDCLTVIRGASPRPKGDPIYFSSERTNYPWIKISDIRKYSKDNILLDTDEFLTKAGMEKSVFLKNGTLILTNSATIAVPIFLGIDGCIHDGYLAFPYFPRDLINEKYIFYFFLNFQRDIYSKARGLAQLNINTSIIKNLLLPLPSINEQARIVAKVDQLMSLCDELEARQQKKRETSAHINSAALDQLLAARAPGEFAEGWRRISDNFDLLYDAPENVGALRKTILQLAVMGKLVAQDERDEPASVLLDKIKVEKERLIKEKKVNKGKPLPIKVEDIPYVAPKGWEWIRLQEIGEFCGGSTPSTNKSEYWGGGIAWVSPKDMKENRIRLSELTISDKALQETRLRIIPKNSILIVARSGILKRLLPIAVNDIECTVNQDLKVIIPFLPQISDYLQLMLKGHEKFILTSLVKGGMTVQSLKYTEFERQPFPLPPLAEQHRIVARVDQLMSLCDQLEAGLRRSQADSEKLMEAVVGKMLAGGDSA